ncbi:hypothetical protein [Azospirillum largimobile]
MDTTGAQKSAEMAEGRHHDLPTMAGFALDFKTYPITAESCVAVPPGRGTNPFPAARSGLLWRG